MGFRFFSFRCLFIFTLATNLNGCLAKSAGCWAERMLSGMSLREKIGQLCVVAISFTNDSKELLASNQKKMKFPFMHRWYVEQMIKKYHVGGIIFLRRSELLQQARLTNELQKMSKLPLLVLEDLEWGLAMRIDNAVKFPRNLTLGALKQGDLVYRIAKEIGRQCKLIGVHMNLAPVIDINTNPTNPVINDRSFGQDKERVARLGSLYMQGLQDAGILACAKHFPGHGDTKIDSHVALPHVKHAKKRLEAIELYPFKRLISDGVAAIMNGHLKVPAYDQKNIATLSPAIVTDLLQKKLGFHGLILTDALNMGALPNYSPEELAIKAFKAGNDLLVVPVDVPRTIAGIEAAVKQGVVREDEINKRVLKILKAKEQLELPQSRLISLKNLEERVNTAAAYQLKKMAYQRAITLVHDKHNLVPVQKNSATAVIQIGGKNESPFMQQFAASQVAKRYYLPSVMPLSEVQKQMQRVGNAKVVVVAIADMQKLAQKNFGISHSTLTFLKQLLAARKKVIVVLFGSPYSIKILPKHDALIVAYEDDPDAQVAAAEVVLGARKAIGQLPVGG